MTRHRQPYRSKVNDSTDWYENESETSWDGRSRITLEYLLEQAINAPEECRIFESDARDGQTTLSGRKLCVAERVNAIITTIPVAPTSSSYIETFQVIQEWEGLVLKVEDGKFTARLIDIASKANSEEGSFKIKSLHKDDITLLKLGAIFRWIIGYKINQNGTKYRSQELVFRRRPQWSQHDISDADKEADELFNAINWQ